MTLDRTHDQTSTDPSLASGDKTKNDKLIESFFEALANKFGSIKSLVLYINKYRIDNLAVI